MKTDRRTVYFVCDLKKIPEQGCEVRIIYLRKVNQKEVQTLRTKLREIELMCEANIMQRNIGGGSSVYLPKEITHCLITIEAGDFDGLYLCQDDVNLPKKGFTYEELPDEWEKIKTPSSITIGLTNLSDVIRDSWWSRIPGYEKK